METKVSNREEEASENIRYSKERAILEKCIPTWLLCKAQVFFEAQRLPNCVLFFPQFHFNIGSLPMWEQSCVLVISPQLRAVG